LNPGQGHNTSCPTLTSGSQVPTNSDFKRVYVAYKTVRQVDGADHIFLMLAWSRVYSSATAAADFAFEFNQSGTPCQTPQQPRASPLPHRTAGDFLITFDFLGGGNVQLAARRWMGSSQSGSWTPQGGQQNGVDLAQSGFAEGAVNTANVPDSLAPGGVDT